MVLRGREKPVV